ncbi:MAG: hypothetical protein P3W87_004585 [Gammaproteobacteria bacterium]|nr:hypothetical protein [Gammaproteobacteria bacterium]
MIKEQFDTTVEAFRQQRDELRLQLHLLGMEAREEWQEAERVWQRLGQIVQRIRDESAHQVVEMVESFRQLADELALQYERLKPMERVAEGMEDLRRMRDELKLQIHLMGMEAREEWEETEKDWNTLLARIEALKDKTGAALDEAAEVARQLRDDLAQRYRNIKARLKD